MKNDGYQTAVDYFAWEIVTRLKKRGNISRDDLESLMTDDLDAFCEDIADEVSERMGWE